MTTEELAQELHTFINKDENFGVETIVKLLLGIPKSKIKTKWHGDRDEPDSLTIIITIPRASNTENHPNYILAKTLFAWYAKEIGGTMAGNFNETYHMGETISHFTWEIPYIHYGS